MHKFKSLIQNSLKQINIECRINPFVDPQSMQQRLITSNNPVIFDVGAHHGETYTDYRNRFAQATIHLIEPFPESANQLKSLVKDDRNCFIHQIALSNANGQKTLYINEASATNSLNELSDGAAERWAASHLRQKDSAIVETRTLDSLCNDLGIHHIDIVKIDVQGGEMEVLNGAAALLGNQSIGLLQFEFIAADTYQNQRPMHEYLQLMDSYKYDLVDIYQPIRRNGKLLQCDLLFASNAFVDFS